ncbi:MAG: hypothetical protein II349_07320, partial [Akkermansia sp.]|nr:hypothetical protein [Akkermansia sp.]
CLIRRMAADAQHAKKDDEKETRHALYMIDCLPCWQQYAVCHDDAKLLIQNYHKKAFHALFALVECP